MRTVQITFDCTRSETHLVRVHMRFPPTQDVVRTFRMANWVPGSYKIRDHGRHVQDFSAKARGKSLRFEQPTKDTWVVSGTKGKPVDLTYDVYARELTVDTSHVTADHAHLFPPTLVMYDADSRPLPHHVQLDLLHGWRAWSGLETNVLDGTLATAADYDHLADCPIEAANPTDVHEERFHVKGRTHRFVAWNAPGEVDWKTIMRDVRAIVAETAKIFGGLPYEHYTFLAHVAMDHGGGLEHRNSTVLGVDPLHLQTDDKRQSRLYPLIAHEFFHTWNVKRIQPTAFQPYELQSETYTGLLWLFEGFTSYYELPILHRSKVLDVEHWSKLVGEDIEWYEKALGRRRISVSQASRLTWTLLYQPHEHNINRNVSYYTKGMWVGLCLDAELRRRGVPGGLDVVMRHLWRKHGHGMGLTEDGFIDVVEQAVEAALPAASATRIATATRGLAAKIRGWTDGTEELPIDAAFRTLGWTVKRDWKDPKKTLGLGIHFKAGGNVIERIPEDSPAWKVLQPDDELVAVESYRFKADRFAELAASRKKAEVVNVTVFREGRLRSFPVPLMEMPKDKISVEHRKGDATATRLRKGWLGEGRKAKNPVTSGKTARAGKPARQTRSRPDQARKPSSPSAQPASSRSSRPSRRPGRRLPPPKKPKTS